MTSEYDIVQQIVDENDLRKWWSQIPNIADDELDLYEYRLYGHYVRVCGSKGGTCRETEKTTVSVCGMSKNKFYDARQSLVDKGYIKILQEGTPNMPGQKGQSTIISLSKEVWSRNWLKFDESELSKRVKELLGQTAQEDNSIQSNGSPQTPSQLDLNMDGSPQTPYGSPQTPLRFTTDPKEEQEPYIKEEVQSANSAHGSISGNSGVSDAPKTTAHLNTGQLSSYINIGKPSAPAEIKSVEELEVQSTGEKTLDGLVGFITTKTGCTVTAPIVKILAQPFKSINKLTGEEIIHESAIERYEADPQFRVYVLERIQFYQKDAKDSGKQMRQQIRRLAMKLWNVEEEYYGYFAWRNKNKGATTTTQGQAKTIQIEE